MSAALVSAPVALGKVDGDPIASKVFKFKLAGGFKKQLKRNHVKMKPKKLKLTKGDVDPTTGAADISLGKIIFKLNHKGFKKCKKDGNKPKRCRRKVVYKNLRGSMPGKVKSIEGKLFKFTAPKSVTRNGFGADLGGIKVKLLKGAAKHINRELRLHSLHKAKAGSASLSYQPKTVKILSGEAQVAGALTAGSVLLKLLGSHCGNIPAPINGATQVNATTIGFPISGGTISPTGTSGIVQQVGGVRITNSTAGACAASPTGSLVQEGFAVNLETTQILAHVVIEASQTLCNPATTCQFTGDKGLAFTQVADPAGAVLTADPANHTISVNGATIRINALSAQTLNAVFPNVSGNPANDFADNDPFGASNLTVQTR